MDDLGTERVAADANAFIGGASKSIYFEIEATGIVRDGNRVTPIKTVFPFKKCVDPIIGVGVEPTSRQAVSGTKAGQ